MRLTSALEPVLSTLNDHTKLLGTPVTSDEFAPLLGAVRKDTRACETELVALAAAGRLLKNDIIYSRFAPRDYLPFQGKLKRLAGRLDGLGVYFALIDPARERFPGTVPPTPAESRPGTPKHPLSRAPSQTSLSEKTTADRPLVPLRQSDSQMSSPAPSIKISASRPSHIQSRTHSARSHLHAHEELHRPWHVHSGSHRSDTLGQTLHHRLLHSSLLNVARSSAKRTEYAVGTFESQRYLNLEATRLRDPNEDEWNEKIQVLLNNRWVPHIGQRSLNRAEFRRLSLIKAVRRS